jgi:hypothetical protein
MKKKFIYNILFILKINLTIQYLKRRTVRDDGPGS